MKRTAILVDKNCSSAQLANTTAILMGEIAVRNEGVYDSADLTDRSEVPHARIRNSVVVLKANSPAQVRNFVNNVKTLEGIVFGVFTYEGQKINNGYAQYALQIGSASLDELTPVGAVIYGEESVVRAATKKYSSY